MSSKNFIDLTKDDDLPSAPVPKFKRKLDEQCQLCAGIFPGTLIRLHCGHIFHISCLKMLQKNKCPICDTKSSDNKNAKQVARRVIRAQKK